MLLSREEDASMNRLFLSGLIGLGLLCVLCAFFRAPEIEGEVREAAHACAEEVGLDPGLISVSGRDITLSGSLDTEALSHHMASCIAAFPGTRSVDNQLAVLVAGALGFHTRSNEITISGVVPSPDAKAAIVDEANSLWGAGNVIDQIEVDQGRTIGGWSDDDFASFLAVLRHSRRDLDIELTGGQAIVGGTVLSNLARNRVLGGAVTILPEFEVVDRLEVREPTTSRGVLQAALDHHLDGKRVEFEVDSANLTPGGRRLLDSVITILRDNPGRIEISGHTDTQGPIADNLELSLRRAETVERYLIAKGLDPDRFDVVGYGPARPIASNATPKGQQLNRRTEFHVLKENNQ
jgi:OOP family OmpA-OmpF porin